MSDYSWIFPDKEGAPDLSKEPVKVCTLCGSLPGQHLVICPVGFREAQEAGVALAWVEGFIIHPSTPTWTNLDDQLLEAYMGDSTPEDTQDVPGEYMSSDEADFYFKQFKQDPGDPFE